MTKQGSPVRIGRLEFDVTPDEGDPTRASVKVQVDLDGMVEDFLVDVDIMLADLANRGIEIDGGFRDRLAGIYRSRVAESLKEAE